jgi:hypothetical protein
LGRIRLQNLSPAHARHGPPFALLGAGAVYWGVRMSRKALSAFLVVSFLALGWSGHGRADDHGTAEKKEFTEPAKLEVNGDKVLIVTHVCSVWDEKCTTKGANDSVIKFAKDNKIPIIYLQHEFDDKAYFCDDKKPNFFAYSSGGEFSFSVKPKSVISTGGYSSYCHRNTMRDLLAQWAKRQESGDVCQVTPAIYESIRSDLLPQAIQDKARLTVYKKYDSATVPLSELLDLFENDEARLEYLKGRVLDYVAKNVDIDFKIAIKYRGKDLVVQEGKGSPPFKLTYRFVHPEPGKPADLSECSK